MGLIKSLSDFINVGIWKIPRTSGYKSYLYHCLKILIMSIKEITKDQVPLKASALTYFSVLSIVPVVATIFGISKGFGFAIDIQTEMAKFFSGQEVVLNQTFIYAQNMLDNAKGGLIAGIGIALLIYTVMRLLNSIEDVFNSIWSVKTARSWIRKFTDYLAIVLFGPVMMVMSSSMTVYIATQIKTITGSVEVLGYVEPLILFSLKLIPYTIIWILFSLVYIIMPNTRVKLKSAIIAGIVAGTAFQLIQWGFINFQVGVAKNNAIYGSLAALPLFLVWTQVSWTVVFIGGEIAYAHQNVQHYRPATANAHLSHDENKKITLLVMYHIVKAFEKGDLPLTKDDLMKGLKVSYSFISDAVEKLLKAGIVLKGEVLEKAEPVYTPAIDINKLTIHFILEKLEAEGLDDINVEKSDVALSVNTLLNELSESMQQSDSNKLLKDI